MTLLPHWDRISDEALLEWFSEYRQKPDTDIYRAICEEIQRRAVLPGGDVRVKVARLLLA